MRTISKWAAALAISVGVLSAEQADDSGAGFIRLVHAVTPAEGPLKLWLNGRDVYPEGYLLGVATGGIRVAAGRCRVRVECPGVETGETLVEVKPGGTTSVIPFGERVPPSDHRPVHWRIGILRLAQEGNEEGSMATLVSVSARPQLGVEIREPHGGWSAYRVKRFGTTRAPLRFPKGYIPMRSGGRRLAAINVIDEGNYVVVLYDDPDGSLRALAFRDFRPPRPD